MKKNIKYYNNPGKGKRLTKELKSNTIICADPEDEFVGCAYCGQYTNVRTEYIKKLKGATQFCCDKCKEIAVYRIGEFIGKPCEVKQIKIEDWAELIDEDLL